MSEELKLLIDETQALAICITNEDQATQNDISQWVDDIVSNLDTIRAWNTRAQPTDKETREALEWFNEIIGLISKSMLLTSDLDIANNELVFIQTIRKAQSRPKLDVESLHRDQPSAFDKGYIAAKNRGWNEALDAVKKLMEGE